MTYVPNGSSFAELDSYALTREAHKLRSKVIGDMVRGLFTPAGNADVAANSSNAQVKIYDFGHSPEAELHMKHANFIVDVVLGIATTLKSIAAHLSAQIATSRVMDELRAFDDRQLADIGISRADIERAVMGDLRNDDTMVVGHSDEMAIAANTNEAARRAA